MPIIHIKSLPLENDFDVKAALEGLSQDFAEHMGIDIKHITVTWEYFPEGHYAVAGTSAEVQPEVSHPILVYLLVPDFYSQEDVENMLECIATSLAARTPVRRYNIFITCRLAQSGMVFDAGKIVHWQDNTDDWRPISHE